MFGIDIIKSKILSELKWRCCIISGTGKMDFERLKNIDVRTVDRTTLKDINEVKIDASLPREQRLYNFIQQIGNPYCYRCGRAVVKISFADTDVTLEDRLEHYLKTI